MGARPEPTFETLSGFLSRIPAVHGGIESGVRDDEWWVQFSIDVTHELAWHAVQELGSVLNYLSLGERLPTVFKPISPPPYLNGGPEDYLSWVIECPTDMSPDKVSEWLESRLPNPVEDEEAWASDDDDDEEETLEPDDEDEEGPFGSLDDDD